MNIDISHFSNERLDVVERSSLLRINFNQLEMFIFVIVDVIFVIMDINTENRIYL
jgi:hypothetical protein